MIPERDSLNSSSSPPSSPSTSCKRSPSPFTNEQEKTRQFVEFVKRPEPTERKIEYRCKVLSDKSDVEVKTFWKTLYGTASEIKEKCRANFMDYWLETALPLLKQEEAITLNLSREKDFPNSKDVTIVKVKDGHYMILQMQDKDLDKNELGSGQSFDVYHYHDVLSRKSLVVGFRNDGGGKGLLANKKIVENYIENPVNIGCYLRKNFRLEEKSNEHSSVEIFAAPCAEHGTLRNLAGKLDFNDAVSFAFELINQIMELHKSGWAHGDLNQDNVLCISKNPLILMFCDLESVQEIDNESHSSEEDESPRGGDYLRDLRDGFDLARDIFYEVKVGENQKEAVEKIQNFLNMDEQMFSAEDFNNFHKLLKENLPSEIEVEKRKEILENFWSCFKAPIVPHDPKKIGEIIFKSFIKILPEN